MTTLTVADCEVTIGRGLPGPALDAKTVAILHQPGIPARVAAALTEHSNAHLIELPDGEAAKTIDVAAGIYRQLNELGLTRKDLVVGVGGGAATDLAGFVAATYLRGVAAAYVPTTLLAAVDAAIGGKTGVNVDGKNLVGVFAHPRQVFIDVDVIEKAPPEVTRQGHAEAVKAGFIGDLGLLDLYERDGLDADLEEVVTRAVRFKIEVVSEDWKEAGRRAILNYGHTVGHAIEVAGAMGHGDAIGIGMRIAADLSEEILGFPGAARQRDIVARLGLPTEIPGLARSDLQHLIGLDKKRDEAGLRMVLLEDFGRPVLRHVGSETLHSAMVAAGAADQ